MSCCVPTGDGAMQHVLWMYVKSDHYRLVIPRQRICVMHDAIAQGYVLVPHGETRLPADRLHHSTYTVCMAYCSKAEVLTIGFGADKAAAVCSARAQPQAGINRPTNRVPRQLFGRVACLLCWWIHV